MIPDLPCLCSHDPYWHQDDCQLCECREYQPDDHEYPLGLGWIVT